MGEEGGGGGINFCDVKTRKVIVYRQISFCSGYTVRRLSFSPFLDKKSIYSRLQTDTNMENL